MYWECGMKDCKLGHIPFLRCPHKRSSMSVVSYQTWLIVAGGLSSGTDECASDTKSNKVELLDTLSEQWYDLGSPWPLPNILYIRHVFMSHQWKRVVPIWRIFKQTCIQCVLGWAHLSSCFTVRRYKLHLTVHTIWSPWQNLIDTPVSSSSLLVVSRALLAFDNEGSWVFYHYQLSSRSWVEAVVLSYPQWECACAVFPSRELFMAAGCAPGDPYDQHWLADIQIATLRLW